MNESNSPQPTESKKAFDWRFVTPLYIGSALNPVNSSFIATALVPIAAAINVPVGQTAVLVAALYMACIVAQPEPENYRRHLGHGGCSLQVFSQYWPGECWVA